MQQHQYKNSITPTNDQCYHSHRLILYPRRSRLPGIHMLPGLPPPSVWASGDPLHPCHTQILSVFFDNFRTLLQQQQQQQQAFYAEWFTRSVLENIRAECLEKPRSSESSIGTTAIAVKSTVENTEHRSTANIALQQTMLQPIAPPEKGWRKGEPLHPYYVLMLSRFENQSWRFFEAEFGGTVVFEGQGFRAEVAEFEAVIMREYTKMWVEMFGREQTG
ncbi:hypothetical protein ACJ72_02192 [Emergomyces africanus]|uniref:Uncharacterized protein n=1 Tax=Emergomyces africanus TaxID=1955775 RepID=A0A1B7P339_9EURO|nr:hypothetical protein ACJ72_02192 [Emergomyces africanus]